MCASSASKVIFLFPRNTELPPKRGDSQRVYLIAEATLNCGLDASVFYFDKVKSFQYEKIKFHPIQGLITIDPSKISKFSIFRAIKDVLYFSMVVLKFTSKNSNKKILYAHTPIGGLIGIIIKPFTKIPLIYDPHDWHYDEWVLYQRNLSNFKKIILNRLFKMLNAIIEKFIDIFICVSPEMMDDVKTKHPKILIPNYAKTTDNDQSYKGHTFAEKKQSILFVGHVAYYQGIFDLLKAFKIVNRKYPNVDLKIIGDGEDLEKAKQFVLQEKLSNVIFFGALPQKEVYPFIVEASVCVAPFISTSFVRTSCPLKILEYAKFGKKIVTTDISSFRRILKDYKKAFFFKNSIDSLSQNLFSALQTSDSPLSLTEKNYMKLFSEKSFQKNVCKLYRYFEKTNKN